MDALTYVSWVIRPPGLPASHDGLAELIASNGFTLIAVCVPLWILGLNYAAVAPLWYYDWVSLSDWASTCNDPEPTCPIFLPLAHLSPLASSRVIAISILTFAATFQGVISMGSHWIFSLRKIGVRIWDRGCPAYRVAIASSWLHFALNMANTVGIILLQPVLASAVNRTTYNSTIVNLGLVLPTCLNTLISIAQLTALYLLTVIPCRTRLPEHYEPLCRESPDKQIDSLPDDDTALLDHNHLLAHDFRSQHDCLIAVGDMAEAPVSSIDVPGVQPHPTLRTLLSRLKLVFDERNKRNAPPEDWHADHPHHEPQLVYWATRRDLFTNNHLDRGTLREIMICMLVYPLSQMGVQAARSRRFFRATGTLDWWHVIQLLTPFIVYPWLGLLLPLFKRRTDLRTSLLGLLSIRHLVMLSFLVIWALCMAALLTELRPATRPLTPQSYKLQDSELFSWGNVGFTYYITYIGISAYYLIYVFLRASADVILAL